MAADRRADRGGGGRALPHEPLAAVLVAAGTAVVALLAPKWTSREARDGRLARVLQKAGLSSDQIAALVDVALTRPAGGEELPGGDGREEARTA